ncbi:MAG: UvrD-helicase domain-containing protein [Lachnospiraceae bacterium]|nr:UvrD-helicase domain-containing protein [Lachnospiraceae bacterium]
MGLLDSLLKRKQADENIVKKVSGKCLELLEWEQCLDKIADTDHYISRKEFSAEIEKYDETMKFFASMDENDILSDYCLKNGFDQNRARSLYHQYEQINEIVDKVNDNYVDSKLIEEKAYLDYILKEVDPVISLDEDQRKVVLSDEDYSLVVAGAGAGKTTTVAAKVKYLVEKQGIDPSQILIISFTNKAVNELRSIINKDLDIPCPIATFHSTGNAILHKNNPEQLNIVDGSKLYYCVQNYFREKILKDSSTVNSLILFFASYFDAPYEGDDINHFFNHMANANYATMRSELDDFREEVIDRNSRKKVTIQNEIVRSIQEVEIANFLYLHNIDYTYESIYKYNISMARKPYTPDFVIQQGDHVAYIEHFGITESGENFLYDKEELEAYKKAINDKVKLHHQHNTELIYTYSAYKDGGSISAHLEQSLIKHGFELKKRSNEEVVKKLVASEENKYINRLVFLVINFIRNFKVNGYDERDFDKLSLKTSNVRTKLFLDIAHACFLEYKKFLVENRAVDFEDMINESARVLNEVKEMQQKLDFKYLIVDEYQDISRQRFDLVKSFSEVTDAKIMAVGDDWQSIYAFSGSDITLFTRFEEKMGYAKLMKIVRTYRNSQEVIDIAGNFIQKNTSQIRKSLISTKHIEEPVIIYTYDNAVQYSQSNRRSGVNYALAYAVQTALDQIINYNLQEGKKSEESKILLLGRFNFDGDRLARTGLFEYVNRGSKVKSVKYPNLNLTFMTAHASKGLGYDNVIVLNGRNETYGFPSKIEDDPVLSLVVKEDKSIQYAEERRLFYVAMTRTKNRVYFVAPEKNPSEFLLEIKKEYKNVYLRGQWSEDEPVILGKHKCPICGFPLQFRYKPAYGLRLYICTNEPEVCDFMTNNLRGKKLSIMKCSDCRDGYLIVKTPKNGGECFLGCSNYKANHQGCNKTLSMREYYKMMGYDPNEIDREEYKPHIPKQQSTIQTEQKAPVQTKNKELNRNDVNEQIQHENWEKNIIETTQNIDVDESRYPMYKGHSIFEIAETVLQCLVSISAKKFYNATILIRTLRGSYDQRILQDKLNLLPEYGKLSYLDRESLNKLVDWLISKHYIVGTKGKYPVLHITSEGLHYKEHMTPRNMKSLVDLLGITPEEVKVQEKANAGAKWSREEDERLKQEFSSGMKITQIAKTHGRSYGAIKARLIKHGLIEK